MRYFVQNSNSTYVDTVKEILEDRSLEIFKFFNKEKCDLDCNVYIYDSIESLIKGLKDRGFGDFPNYMCACQKDEDNSINYFEPKDNPTDDEWSKEGYNKVIYHELIHSIEFNLFGEHPEWLSEGIAVTLDGTYSKGIKSLLENYVNKLPVPPQREIEEEFGKHSEYDSYDYAYLMVSYMIEVNGHDKFIKSLSSREDFLQLYSDNLLEDSISYFNDKFSLKSDFTRIK